MTRSPAYLPLAGHYDEMVGPDGALRSHWQPVTNALDAAGRHELNRRTQEARRLIRDNGMTFHVHRRGGTRERPWPLDLIPCLIDGAEWTHLERAIAQRARRLEAVLDDLYGPRRLVREGALPADWLHANPAFLRGCDGLQPPAGRWLHIYAADPVRSPDGGWWVLGDRTEAPAGMGFALENRIVVNAVLPDLLVASKARRLAATFEARRLSLVVVLTPGPTSENYFEHAFLARYMGYTLVEGTDLTVRNYRVYIKTLGGLQPVDLILRVQHSEACDPLEFGGPSQSGVPGLVEAVRRGSVAVINPLGVGIAQSPALMAFLPALCRRLLDAELLLPSVATWWCGDEAARAHVLDHLDELVIKPAYPSVRRERMFGRRLPEGQRARLADRIARQPHRYVAQEQVALSTAPVRVAGGLSPRFLVIRVYALSRGDGYDVLPGGLGRVSSSTDSLDVTRGRTRPHRAAARRHRQRDHLPVALSHLVARQSGRRSAAARRRQPAGRGLPARPPETACRAIARGADPGSDVARIEADHRGRRDDSTRRPRRAVRGARRAAPQADGAAGPGAGRSGRPLGRTDPRLSHARRPGPASGEPMNSAPPPRLEYRVKHTSRYAYAETVSLSMHLVRLTPRPSGTQTVGETRLLIDPPASGSITRKDSSAT